LPVVPKNWKKGITEIALRTHSIFSRHPWALISILSAPPGLNAMRHMEQCLEALAETSMTAKQKVTLLAMVDDFVFGHALREAANQSTAETEFATAQMASGVFPRLAEVFTKVPIENGQDRLRAGLRLLIEQYSPRLLGTSPKPRRNSSRRDKRK
jgi:hypothetical protein